jgi:TolB-like protein/Flp pilus assembly protein TadD
MTPDIFLSYTREDQATAQRFAEAFEAQGFSVWWDMTLRSGEAYDQVTEEALRTAKAVVVLWSPRSVISRWVRAEATLADRSRTLVPARIEACDLPIMFELTQTADLSRWTGEPTASAWRAFLGDVRRFIEAGAAPVATSAAQTASKPPPRSIRPSIAVLPFVNRSGFSEDDIFADGMVEDLTGALSVSRKMKVMASSATATYRKGAMDLRQIGRDLGVRYLLEGNVRRVGDDLRVTAQLVEGEDGDILWTKKFDRPLAEISALQEDLVTEVAAHLGVEVQRAEMEHALRKPGDITAWEAVLRAEANLSRLTHAGWEAAAAEAKRAVEIEPGYDLAYATLALAQAAILTFEDGDDPELAQELLSNVARVRALDPSDPITLARLATALCLVGRLQEGLPFAERAVMVNPNLEIPHTALGNILRALGRWDEAVPEFEAAERLAPNGAFSHGPLFWRAVAHFRSGELARSLEATEAALRQRPTALVQIHRAICLAVLERWDQAREAMRAFCVSDAASSLPMVERLVRNNLYVGTDAARVDDYVAIARRLWDEPESDA